MASERSEDCISAEGRGDVLEQAKSQQSSLPLGGREGVNSRWLELGLCSLAIARLLDGAGAGGRGESEGNQLVDVGPARERSALSVRYSGTALT